MERDILYGRDHVELVGKIYHDFGREGGLYSLQDKGMIVDYRPLWLFDPP